MSVRSPDVSALYGPDGAFTGSSCCCCCCLRLGVGTALPHPPEGCGRAGELGEAGLLPCTAACRGGAPKLSGSLSVVKGALWWFRASSYGSFFFPVAIPLMSDFHESRWIDRSPEGCQPPFATPLSLSMLTSFVVCGRCGIEYERWGGQVQIRESQRMRGPMSATPRHAETTNDVRGQVKR